MVFLSGFFTVVSLFFSRFLMDLIMLSPAAMIDSLVAAFPSSPVGIANQRLVDSLSGRQLASGSEGGPQLTPRATRLELEVVSLFCFII